MATSRKSIIKEDKERDDNPRKRLSFAPDTERSKSTVSKRKRSEGGSQGVSSVVSTVANSACKMTTLGLYYDPKAVAAGILRQHRTTPMFQSDRHDFKAFQDFSSFSGKLYAKVLIIGGKIFAEKLKAYLMEAHEKQHTSMDLDITCEEDLPTHVTAHIVLALFFKDTHQSMNQLFNIAKRCTEGSLSSKRVMFVCVSSAEGSYKNVVDLEQFHTLLSTHHLVHLTLKEQGRLGHGEVNAMLKLIQKSVGHCIGTSLLMDYTMQIDLKNCYVDDVVLQDSGISDISN